MNKELKELIVGLLEISALMAHEFKDGIQTSDFLDIVAKIQANNELKDKLLTAYNGIDQVPNEVKDLSLAEAADLIAFSIPKIIEMAQKIKA